MNFLRARTLVALPCVAALSLPCFAQSDHDPLASRIDVVQVTATRFSEPVQEVPVSMAIVTHDDLIARGANDLRTALALVAGAGVAPGGDAGPAGAVPGLLGTREADDFLLLIDDVPAGGAFTPPFEAISLNNVERIEILRGSAPVYFGTTAFAGTINVIHYKAGSAAPEFKMAAGSYGSAAVSGARVLSVGLVRQSLAAELSHDRLSDHRAGFNRAQGDYRLSTAILGGDFRLDLHLLSLRQRPASPTPVNASGQLTNDVSADFNQNPGDAKLDTSRQQLVLGYDESLPIGRWGTTLSYAHTHVDAVQGFLLDGGLETTGTDNAQGAHQTRSLRDLFFDTHVTDRPLPWLDLTYGLNELYGRAQQASDSFTYLVPVDGSRPSNLADGTEAGNALLLDRRSFFGLYGQSRVRLSPDVSMLAGLRLSHTAETRETASAAAEALAQSSRTTRLNGSVGGLWEVWRDKSGDLDDVSVYASLGNTFQPPQLDFGADAGSQPLLRPETQRSLNLGLKADGDDGRFDVDLEAFFVAFSNQAITSQAGGSPVLQNGGNERYHGVQVEASFRPVPGWSLSGNISQGQAKYRQFTTLIDGAPASLEGRYLVLTPRLRSGAAVAYTPDRGPGFSMTANYTGARYLDELNQARVEGFTTVDASLNWRFDTLTLTASGSNITNRRDAVLASELGESQIYRMPGRRIFMSAAIRFR
jgi:iron complex outermembrane receptor protein